MEATFPASDAFGLIVDEGPDSRASDAFATVDEDPNSRATYASPPCFMHELDPSYLGLQPARGARSRRCDEGEGAGRMSANMAGIPRYRPFEGPALLRQGFRPFFLGAGLWALAAMTLWIAALQGYVALPTAFDPVAWHVHEMLFGFVVAAIAGFLLTAIPNWTGRMPLQGLPLALLVVVWLAGRLAVYGSERIGAGIAAALDLAFLALLLGVVLAGDPGRSELAQSADAGRASSGCSRRTP